MYLYKFNDPKIQRVLVLNASHIKVNLEYLGRVVVSSNGMLCPDSVVGTDSHTTMINGLGIVGWGM